MRFALQAAGAHVEKPPEFRRDAQEIAGETVIQPCQILVLSLDDLSHRLFDIGHLAREGLHQRRIGRFRFVMQALESFRDRAAAE